MHDGYLFPGMQLCLLATSIRKYVVREWHGGWCSSHLGCDKTLELIGNRYFWPREIRCCKNLQALTSLSACKGQKENSGLYQPHYQPHMLHGKFKFQYGIRLYLSNTAQKVDELFIVVDRISKMTNYL